MGMVIPIHSHRIFTREEAEELLPIVRRMTEQAASKAGDLQERLRFVPVEEHLHERLSIRLDTTVKMWAAKISHLGCEPRGIWLVDFETGDGWLSWRYGDDGLNYFHSRNIYPEHDIRPEELPS